MRHVSRRAREKTGQNVPHKGCTYAVAHNRTLQTHHDRRRDKDSPYGLCLRRCTRPVLPERTSSGGTSQQRCRLMHHHTRPGVDIGHQTLPSHVMVSCNCKGASGAIDWRVLHPNESTLEEPRFAFRRDTASDHPRVCL